MPFKLEQFSRITSSQRFIPVIDGLRFVAISWVVFFHINQFYGYNGPLADHAKGDPVFHLLNVGEFGVRLFFIISGFILALPFAEANLCGKHQVSLKKYFWRRLTRLEPPYIISLLVYFGLRYFAQGAGYLSATRDLLLSFFYANMAFHNVSRVNYVTWSLEYEIQFYILMPLLSTVFFIKNTAARRLVLASVILGLGAVKTFLHPQPFFCILDEAQFFVSGLLLCDFYLLSWKESSKHPYVWDAVGLAGWIALIAVIEQHFYYPLLSPVFSLVAYAAAMRGTLWNRFLCWKPIVIIGGMCYTIYLYHVLLLAVPQHFTFQLIRFGDAYGLNVLVQCMLLSPLIFLMSAFLFAWFERPFMVADWPKKVIQRYFNGKQPAIEVQTVK